MNPSPAHVSIVMPTLNQHAFIGDAVRSVFAQPEVDELVVIDGGSADGTVQALAALADQHAGRLRWVSGADSGPAQAVNRAVALARGRVIGWLNSDDLYTPGAVGRALAALEALPGAVMVYGEGEHIDAAGAPLGRYPTLPPATPIDAFAQGCFICQPTAFFLRDVFIGLGGLDESLRAAFDFDLWLRLFKAHAGRIGWVPQVQALSRLHAGSITLRQRERVALEGMAVLHRHLGSAPPEWLLTCVAELCDAHPFEPQRTDLAPELQRLATAAQPWLDAPGRARLQQCLQHDKALQLMSPDAWAGVMPDGWAGPSLGLRLRQGATPFTAIVLRCRHAQPQGGMLHIRAAGTGFGTQSWRVQRPGPFALVIPVTDAQPGAPLQCEIRCDDSFVPAAAEPGSGDMRQLCYLVDSCQLVKAPPGLQRAS